jgi:hypothetical protein
MTANLKEICQKLGITVKVYKYDVFHVYLRKADFKKACQKHGFSSIKHRVL